MNVLHILAYLFTKIFDRRSNDAKMPKSLTEMIIRTQDHSFGLVCAIVGMSVYIFYAILLFKKFGPIFSLNP